MRGYGGKENAPPCRRIERRANARNIMRRFMANGGRVLAGVVVLFAAYVAGALLCGYLFPSAARANKMEMVTDKIGASVGIFIAGVLLRRYFLRSFGLVLVCLAATEIVALVIIVMVTGLVSLTLFDITFNLQWLYAMTWNVVIAYLLGATVGHVWDKRADKTL